MFPEIPVMFPQQFPNFFQNTFPGWGCFSREIVEANRGKLLMLDLDFGKSCSRRCGCCFRTSPGFDHGNMIEMPYEQVCSTVLQGVELGLRHIKILGAGEPFENKKFLGLLRFFHTLGLTVSVFTKGQVIASDKLAALYNRGYGITTASQLAEELRRLDVGLIVGFNKIAAGAQDSWVGVPGHTKLRNKALEILAEVGFNNTNPTRLAVGCSPVTTANIGEMYEIYEWARRRNIYTVMCPTMASASEDRWQKDLPSIDALVDLYTRIYRFNIEFGIQTLEQLQKDGISAYAGVAPCNQVACGLYVTLDGVVHGCPGDDEVIHGDLRKQRLEEIWLNSPNRLRAGKYNCHCPAKGKLRQGQRPIPPILFKRVLRNLETIDRQISPISQVDDNH